MSAYQDKFVDKEYDLYKSKYYVETFGERTFENFVKMVLKSHQENCQDLNNCLVNVHWRTYISRCGFCNIPYKVISKAETFAEDLKFIGKLANFDFKLTSSSEIFKFQKFQ